jgi:hypothetical protein
MKHEFYTILFDHFLSISKILKYYIENSCIESQKISRIHDELNEQSLLLMQNEHSFLNSKISSHL